MTALAEAIAACDRLNSWLRSSNSRGDWHCRPRRAVYYLKGQLINVATRNGLAKHSAVFTLVKCRSCDGTGKFIPWHYESTGVKCRTCDAKGTHPLYFLESAIDSRGIVWHTPVKYGFSVEHPVRVNIDSLKPFRLVGDSWKPQMEGRGMEPWEVARDLNVVEALISARPGDYFVDDLGGPFDDFKYDIFVGDAERFCFRCGKTLPESQFSEKFQFEWSHLICHRDAICWGAFLCRPCESTFNHSAVWSAAENRYVVPGGSMFDAAPFPSDLVQHPEIQRWQHRQLAYRHHKKV